MTLKKGGKLKRKRKTSSQLSENKKKKRLSGLQLEYNIYAFMVVLTLKTSYYTQKKDFGRSVWSRFINP